MMQISNSLHFQQIIVIEQFCRKIKHEKKLFVSVYVTQAVVRYAWYMYLYVL